MLSVKHQDAKRVIYNSGFFITTNMLPDFGNEMDQASVYRRLEVFKCKPLPTKDKTVTGNKLSLV